MKERLADLFYGLVLLWFGLCYDPANLVTLCKECHDQFHQLYGNDAGLEDFEEYLKP